MIADLLRKEGHTERLCHPAPVPRALGVRTRNERVVWALALNEWMISLQPAKPFPSSWHFLKITLTLIDDMTTVGRGHFYPFHSFIQQTWSCRATWNQTVNQDGRAVSSVETDEQTKTASGLKVIRVAAMNGSGDGLAAVGSPTSKRSVEVAPWLRAPLCPSAPHRYRYAGREMSFPREKPERGGQTWTQHRLTDESLCQAQSS